MIKKLLLTMIKKLLLTMAMIATTALPALANTTEATETETIDDYCRAVMTLSTEVMRNRQAGVPMTPMIDLLATKSNDDEARKKFNLAMIMQAYEEPKYSTYEYQEQASIEFGNQYYIACMKTHLK